MNLKEYFYLLRYGKWSSGIDPWDKRDSIFDWYTVYYDGYHLVVRIFGLWIEIDD